MDLPRKIKSTIDKYLKSDNIIIKTIAQFISFGLVGALNTVIYLIIYYFFVIINKNLYIIGSIAGYVVSILNAYYWNSKFVFKTTKLESDNSGTKSLVKTFASYGLTLLLSITLLYVMIEKIHISDKIAPLFNLLVTVPLNFILIKYWALKMNEKPNDIINQNLG